MRVCEADRAGGAAGLGSRPQGSSPGLAHIRTSWRSLSKCKPRGWGRVLTYELGDGGTESTGCLPHLAFVTLSLRWHSIERQLSQVGECWSHRNKSSMPSNPTGPPWAPGLPMALSLLGNEGWFGGQATARAEPQGRKKQREAEPCCRAGPAPSRDSERSHHPRASPNSLAFEEVTASTLTAQLGLLGRGQGLGVRGHSCTPESSIVPM